MPQTVSAGYCASRAARRRWHEPKVESHILRPLAPQLSVAVPNWRIHSDTLIAYPLLPGVPGLGLNEQGELVWAVDVSSKVCAESLRDPLAQLHQIPLADAATTGITVRTPEQAKQEWRQNIKRVTAAFAVADHLLERWRDWLAEDSYWPTHTVLTHGEIYPGHTLVSQDRICGVLDWITASITDPARDFAFHHATATPAAFELALQRLPRKGGRTWPRLAEHCAELFAANPVGYGIYALETGDPAH